MYTDTPESILNLLVTVRIPHNNLYLSIFYYLEVAILREWGGEQRATTVRMSLLPSTSNMSPAAKLRRTGGHILCVGDAIDLGSVSSVLRSARYDVTVVPGSLAIEALETGIYQLCFLTLGSSSVQVFQLMDEIKQAGLGDLLVLVLCLDATEKRIVRRVIPYLLIVVAAAPHPLFLVLLSLAKRHRYWVCTPCLRRCRFFSLFERVSAFSCWLRMTTFVPPPASLRSLCSCIELGATDVIISPFLDLVRRMETHLDRWRREVRPAIPADALPSNFSSPAQQLLRVFVIDDSPSVLKFLGFV